ncbi:diaminopimelate decarboxylase [Halodesulfovibrio spirochaetisodalis]|uniref:Diaminopimelate decarboxylase n=1 Tax=Halodesulfovibrio spirochaetisodalis TaxID=1560234 RepID=A0A1B7XAQ4_9BACT|nr:diaminopimelate decarboxylase [Halodesulfovibrio spirochaetisodalis]OBQ46445.1 diaminopimelate decarboxylase [Halodesulfovibrio spirochaetisodalis]
MSNVRSTYTDSVNFYGNNTPMELVKTFGSPLYVYNENVLRTRCREVQALSDNPSFTPNYSAKANTNIHLLKVVQEEGMVVDAMSPGEIVMNLAAGFTPEQILFISNNVSAEELQFAIDRGVYVSVDSLSQLDLFGQLNPGGKVVIRFNPGIGAGHHAKVVTGGKQTKFGVDPESADTVREILGRHNLTLCGVNMHIGSLFMEPDGYLEAMGVLLSIAKEWMTEGNAIEIIDFGGGFGIPYRKYDGEERLDLTELGKAFHATITQFAEETGYTGRFMCEPGRYIAAECGVLLGTCFSVKNNGEKRFAGTDLGFNQLMRPAMYDSFHDVEIYREGGSEVTETMEQTIVGNICESGDIMAKDRQLPEIAEGDVIAMLDAGAYGYVMASPYNQRPRPAEVLIQENGEARLIRRRETLNDLLNMYPEADALISEFGEK